MAEAVAVGRIGDSGGQHGSAHRHLRQGGIQVVTDLPPGLGITPAVVLGERPLPGLTLPLSGRQETGGGEAESWWRPVHSKGLFGVSHNNRQTRQILAQSNVYVT